MEGRTEYRYEFNQDLIQRLKAYFNVHPKPEKKLRPVVNLKETVYIGTGYSLPLIIDKLQDFSDKSDAEIAFISKIQGQRYELEGGRWATPEEEENYNEGLFADD